MVVRPSALVTMCNRLALSYSNCGLDRRVVGRPRIDQQRAVADEVVIEASGIPQRIRFGDDSIQTIKTGLMSIRFIVAIAFGPRINNCRAISNAVIDVVRHEVFGVGAGHHPAQFVIDIRRQGVFGVSNGFQTTTWIISLSRLGDTIDGRQFGASLDIQFMSGGLDFAIGTSRSFQ